MICTHVWCEKCTKLWNLEALIVEYYCANYSLLRTFELISWLLAVTYLLTSKFLVICLLYHSLLLLLAEISWKENLVSCVDQLRLSFAMFICAFICIHPTGHNSTTVFTKLHTQIGTSLQKNWLDFQGHRVTGQGHTLTTAEILGTW